MRGQQPVIIKRGRGKRGDDTPVGGAWKVAFADFTLAMMALFLILWILSASSQEERETVSGALRNYSIFSGDPSPFELGKSLHPFDLEGYASIIEGVATDILSSGNHSAGVSLHNQQVEGGNKASGTGKGTSLNTIIESPYNSMDSMSILADLIREMGKQLDALGNLAVDVVPHGVRIRLQDDENREMFARGGSTMDPFFEDLLLAIAPVFQRIDNSLVISGHTDSTQFQGSEYSNWELSGDRAHMARKLLDIGGVPAEQVIQVVAMADRVPANAGNAGDSSNRRIEILVLTDKAKAELTGLFDSKDTNSALSRAKRSALQNQPVTR
jgi:chemotaxis protein MotB